jgi:hypothetical protein
MADETHDPNAAGNDAAAKRLADDRVLTEESRRQFAERMKGKPTPTQEENDLAALGAHFHTHADDGSGPDLHAMTRQMEPGKGASYQTRHGVAGGAGGRGGHGHEDDSRHGAGAGSPRTGR